MTRTFLPIPFIDPPSRKEFESIILQEAKPVVMKGLANDWPAVRHGKKGPRTLFNYLSDMDTGKTQGTLVKNTEKKGRFFYSEDLRSQNFKPLEETASLALETLLAPPDKRLRYIQSVPVDEHFKTFSKDNKLFLVDESIPARAWIGGKTRVQTHFDCNENIAVCVLGQREIVLFPPDQLSNLYVGPLETAPAGVFMSLTNLEQPDFEAHPKFKTALEVAQTATLMPGDAIYIPFGWWHNVTAKAPLNMLVNYWWSQQSSQVSNQFAAMSHAMMAFRGLSANQRMVWSHLFSKFAFMEDGEPMEHLPKDLRGILGGVPDAHKASAIYELLTVLGKEIGIAPPSR